MAAVALTGLCVAGALAGWLGATQDPSTFWTRHKATVLGASVGSLFVGGCSIAILISAWGAAAVFTCGTTVVISCVIIYATAAVGGLGGAIIGRAWAGYDD